MLKRITLALLCSAAAWAQITPPALTQSTLTSNASAANVALTLSFPFPFVPTGTLPGMLYVDSEAMTVVSASLNLQQVTVQRGARGTTPALHYAGAVVLSGGPSQFIAVDKSGACDPNSPQLLNVTDQKYFTCTAGSWVSASTAPTSSGGATGPAGGDLSGTYPNPALRGIIPAQAIQADQYNILNSLEQYTWSLVATPVVVASPGTFRQANVTGPSAQVVGPTIYLTFASYDNAGVASLGLVTGNNVAQLTAATPTQILTGTAATWDAAYVSGPRLFWDPPSSKCYLYYFGSANASGFEAAPSYIGVASASTCAGPFTKYVGNPIVSTGGVGTWNAKQMYRPMVVQTAPGAYSMWVNGATATGGESIGLYTATSPVGPWTPYAGNPVMSPSQAWEGTRVGDPFIWIQNGYYYMGYYGANTEGWASSPDGITWTKSTANPIVPIGIQPQTVIPPVLRWTMVFTPLGPIAFGDVAANSQIYAITPSLQFPVNINPAGTIVLPYGGIGLGPATGGTISTFTTLPFNNRWTVNDATGGPPNDTSMIFDFASGSSSKNSIALIGKTATSSSFFANNGVNTVFGSQPTAMQFRTGYSFNAADLTTSGVLDFTISTNALIASLGTKWVGTHGTNGATGVVALVAGTATVNTTSIAALAASGGAGDWVELHPRNCTGILSFTTVTGTSLTINDSVSEACDVKWILSPIQ